ncbi:MAG: hypothetical protein MHM6MM_004342 [Cercozoa sp. M6MM]
MFFIFLFVGFLGFVFFGIVIDVGVCRLFTTRLSADRVVNFCRGDSTVVSFAIPVSSSFFLSASSHCLLLSVM